MNQPAITPAVQSGSEATLSPELALLLLEYIYDQLPQTADYVEQQAIDIVTAFKDLSQQTAKQSHNMEAVVDVARTIEMNGEKIPYEKSVEILYEPLAEAISKILQVSRLAMSMVMTIGNAADNVSRVETCIDQVQILTRQTNMLAMNTQIEAARAGEAGRSFRIIAQEVKSLSENIREVSQQIQNEMGQVSDSVKQSSSVVDQLAHYDMTENLELRDKIDQLIESIMEQNRRFTELLHESANSAQHTARSIGNLVVGIQFQDRNSQVIADLRSMLGMVIETLKAQIRQLGPVDEALIRTVIDELRLSDVRNGLLGHLHHKSALHADSSIYQQYLAKPVAAAPDLNEDASGQDGDIVAQLFPGGSSDDDDDDDDIELF